MSGTRTAIQTVDMGFALKAGLVRAVKVPVLENLVDFQSTGRPR